MNYFKIICFIWASIGIISRIIMAIMGPKWKAWELNSAYAPKKPMVINLIGLFGYLLVIFTWYKFFTTQIRFSWIIATLLSLTVIKISTIIFNYTAFRKFAVETLNNEKKMFLLNIGVIIYSITLVSIGVLLY